MVRKHVLVPMVLAAFAAFPAAAHEGAQHAAPQMTPEQQAEMAAYEKAGTPGAEHAALAKTVGSYALQIKSWMAPDTDPMVSAGKATRAMTLGGRVLVEEVSAEMMGSPFTGHGMHGFDNASGQHWATWNDSMSTGVMVSRGSCDAAGSCTFTGSWVDPVTKKEVGSRMTSRWTSPTVEVFTMYGPGPDGKEMTMMEITYTKQ